MRLLKTQTFEIKGNLSSKTKQMTSFSPIIEYEEPQRTIYKGPRGFLAITVEGSNKINSLGPKRLLKTQTFGKKGNISSKGKNFGLFSEIIEQNKY